MWTGTSCKRLTKFQRDQQLASYYTDADTDTDTSRRLDGTGLDAAVSRMTCALVMRCGL